MTFCFSSRTEQFRSFQRQALKVCKGRARHIDIYTIAAQRHGTTAVDLLDLYNIGVPSGIDVDWYTRPAQPTPSSYH